MSNRGWNRPSAASQPIVKKDGAKAPSVAKGIVAGLAIVIPVIAILIWLFSSGEDSSKAVSDKGPRRIKEAKPSVAATTNALPAKPVNPRDDYDHAKFYRDKSGVLRFIKGDSVAPDPTRPVIIAKDYYDKSRAIFSYRSERTIYDMVARKPGSGKIWGRVNFHDPGFLENFQASLKEPIIVSHDDSERVKAAKRSMIEMKKEICDRMRDGESLGDILTNARKELQRLNECKRNLEQEIGKFIEKEGGANEQDLDDYITAANMILEKDGVKPLDKDMFVEWNLRLAAERDAVKGNPESAKKEAEAPQDAANAGARQVEP